MPDFEEESHPDPWAAHMLRGDFEAAWKISDEYLRSRAGIPCWHRPRHLQYVWDGTPLEKKRVLVRCYHGLGDTILFIRYAPLVKRIAKEVIVWCQPALIPLLRTLAGIDRLLPLHDGSPEAEYDVNVESMELPHIFRTTLRTVPAAVPYFRVPPARLGKKGGIAVGLVWRSGDWGEGRSIPFSLLEPLADVPGAAFHILQRGPGLAEWDGRRGVLSGSDLILEVAAVMRALDLVISVDTMPAHLAGALAVPVWTLLPAEPDWKWMNGREDTPWYPTMRLFRQEDKGKWEPVVARAAGELKNFAKEHPSRC